VSLQNFFTVVQFNGSINSFAVNGATPPAGSFLLFDYSPSGNVTAPLAVVSNLGCNAVRSIVVWVLNAELTKSSLIILQGFLEILRLFPVEAATLD
jgi:hypothetical protein